MLPSPLSPTSGRAFRLIVDRGELTRPELADLLGVTKQTVSHAVAELELRQLAGVTAPRQGWTGRSALQYALHPSAGWVAGVDLGTARLHVTAARLDGTVVAERRVTNPYPTVVRSWPDQLDLAAHALADLASKQSESQGGLLGIGIAVPRPVAVIRDLVTTQASREDESLLAALSPIAPAAIWTENDINCSALAQAPVASAGRTVLFLHVGLGLGAALVVDGRVLRGARGRAGEIKSLRLPPYGTSVETRLSAAGLLAAAGHSVHAPLIGAVDDLFAAAHLGDEVAEAAIAGEVEGLVDLLHELTAVVDPDVVVLAGYLGARADLRGRVSDAARDSGVAAAVISDELGDRAPARGAALMAAGRVIDALVSASSQQVRGRHSDRELVT